jgi:putative oxidoreductase
MTAAARTAPLSRAPSFFESALAAAERVPLSLSQLLARLAVAVVFWRSGQTKTANWDITVELFRDEYRVPLLPPDLAATLATSFELGCSALLAVGLFARLATLPILAMTFVIQLSVYPNNWPDHLLWTAPLVLIFSRGAGAISLDHVAGRLLKMRGSM